MEEYSSTRWKCIETEREREIVAKFDFCILAILRQMKNYSAKQPPYRKVYRCELSRIKKWWSMPRGKTRHPTIDYVSRWRGWNFYRRRLTTVKRLPRSESIKMKKKKKKKKRKNLTKKPIERWHFQARDPQRKASRRLGKFEDEQNDVVARLWRNEASTEYFRTCNLLTYLTARHARTSASKQAITGW